MNALRRHVRSISARFSSARVFALAVLALLGALGGPALAVLEMQNLDLPPRRPALPDSVMTAARAAADAANRFGCDLYGKLRTRPGNLVFSPFSVSTGLAMACAGAAGTTWSEMATALRWARKHGVLHESYGSLLRSERSVTSPSSFRLKVADRLWGQRGSRFREAFLRVTREQYGAQLEALDFAAAPEASRQTINAWVSEKTDRRITDLLAPGMIVSATRLVVTSAVDFYGSWAAPFDTMATNVEPFHVSRSKTVEVPLMHRKCDCSLGRVEDLSILELPYRMEDLTMVVILPDSTVGLGRLEGRLTAAALRGWLAALHPVERADVYLPRWRFDSRFTLNEPLQSLGMVSAFDAQSADFSGMDGARDLSLALVAHQAYVDVDERGTEAAAATASGLALGYVREGPNAEFRADHPFLFLIRDKLTGCILFLGRVVNPAETAS
ncbi:MAG: serpin family protein [bacterium]